MGFPALLYALLGAGLLASTATGDESKARGKAGNNQEVLGHGIDGERYKTACPDYKHYAVVPQYVPIASVTQFSEHTDLDSQPTLE